MLRTEVLLKIRNKQEKGLYYVERLSGLCCQMQLEFNSPL